MKITKLVLTACLILFTTTALANAREELQTRLAKVTTFYAEFHQKVVSAKGENIQEASGEVWVKRPNLFRWHTDEPDESLLISDGKTLWFYNPFVEQVTATWLKDATSNTPFILIAQNNLSDWEHYRITQDHDQFTLEPKEQLNNLNQFIINISKEGNIHSFVAIEHDGQRNQFELSKQNNNEVDDNLFHFEPAEGITVDDQRQHEQ